MSEKTPFDTFKDAFAAAQQQNATGQPKEPEPVQPLVSVADSMAELVERWGQRDEAVSTGFVQLDALLSGGVRAGDMLALVGLAKGGKSALWGQVLYQLAQQGALGVYASVEMPRAEVVSRWVVRLIWLGVYGDGNTVDDWAVSYGDVLYGRAHRGEDSRGRPIHSAELADSVRDRLHTAMKRAREPGERLFVEHLAPGSTCLTLRSIVERAKAQTGHTGLTVLLVDPIQRLFAHESEACKGVALERMNADETPRVTMVAQQLIGLAQDKALNLAVLFTSDTTKGAAFRHGADSATDMRGTYMLNHAATAIFDVTSAPWDDLCKMLAGENPTKDEITAVEDRLRARPDMTMLGNRMAQRLGAKVAYLNCSGNRRGPNGASAFTFVPGAMSFSEAPNLDADTLDGDGADMPRPSSNRGPRKGKR